MAPETGQIVGNDFLFEKFEVLYFANRQLGLLTSIVMSIASSDVGELVPSSLREYDDTNYQSLDGS